MTLEFTVRGLPIPQGSSRARVVGGRPIIVSKTRALTAWRSAITTAATTAMAERPVMAGPLAVTVRFLLPRPVSAPKRVLHPATRPDLDKLIRAVMDGCSSVVYRDDAQVVELDAAKRFASDGVIGAFVAIREVGDG